MGKPLLTTDAPGCRDVVDDRMNGYLCQPRTADSLSAGMNWLLSRSKAELVAMGQASRRKAEQEFDERIVIDRYLRAIKEIEP